MTVLPPQDSRYMCLSSSLLMVVFTLGAVLFLGNFWPCSSSIEAAPLVEFPSEDVPSFYWASQRFGWVMVEQPDGQILKENAIVEWKPHSDIRQMEVRVSELWLQLPYDSRYRLVRGLGDIAARKGYSLMVLDPNSNIVATYTCLQESGQIVDCQISFEPTPRL